MPAVSDYGSRLLGPSESTRRRFLQRTALLTLGTLGMLASRTPPAVGAAKRKLTMLDWNHFVPIYEEKLREWAHEFAQANNCEVKLDQIAHRDLYVRLTSEAETQSGHDIVMWWTNPQLYAENLIDLDDLSKRIGEKGGGWYQIARDVNVYKGHWKAVPLYASIMPQTYRDDLFAEVGEGRPDRWEDVLRAGRTLKAKEFPSGFALAQTEDANITLYALLWSFGTSTVDEKGQVIINNPRTEAIAFAKAMYKEMLTEEVLSWDDAGNNRAFLSGKWAWVHNAVSIYAAEPKNAAQLRAVTGHELSPQGPGGRHGVSIPFNYGIWKCSKNQELAKEFLTYIGIRRGRNFVRGAILLPFIVPTALRTLAWWWMFESLYSVINWTIIHLGLAPEGPNWLGDPFYAKVSVIIVNLWRGLPFFAVTILAGLVSIPLELYDAAKSMGPVP